MIPTGGARGNGTFFAKHLMRADENERVEVKEMRGLYAENVKEAFLEMRMLASATNAKNYFYHASLNPRADEHLTPEQWEFAVDRLEHNLGLDGQPRFQVEHEKLGDDGQLRTHRHIVWSRVNLDTLTVIPATYNYAAHDRTRAELEIAFGHERTPDTPEPSQRKSRQIKDWEHFKASDGRSVDPIEMKAEITELWQHSDSGVAFQAAVEDKGYLLAKGDRRDFVVIDDTGHIHSLARRIEGAKAADIRAKMVDLDRDSLMTAHQASAWMKGKEEAENSGSSDARILPEEQAQERELPSEGLGGIVPPVPPAPFHNPKLAVLEKYALEHPPELEGYIAVNSPEEITDYYRKVFAAPVASPEYWERTAQEDHDRWAWNSEQARLAEIDRRQAQASRDYDPPEGEPPLEPVTFAEAARGVDLPPSFTERERDLGKSEQQSWTEYIEGRNAPELTDGHDKGDDDDRSR